MYIIKIRESQFKLKLSTYYQRARDLLQKLDELNIPNKFEIIEDDEDPTFLDADDIKYELGMYNGLGTKEEQIERLKQHNREVKRRYREENKDKIKEREDKYYNENRVQILEKNKEYRQTHKEQIRETK